jgi:hypothetical protein
MLRREALIGLATAPLAIAGNRNPLDDVLRAEPLLRRVRDDPSFELQAIWTRYRWAGGWVAAAEHRVGVDDRRWFAAASFVKPILALALAELLSENGLASPADLRLHIEGPGCAPLPALPMALDEAFARMLALSDNAAFNALYELIGSDELHRRLRAHELPSVRIPQRLGCNNSLPRKAGARLVDALGATVWRSPAGIQAEQPQRFAFGAVHKGNAWLDNGKLVPGPHDFTRSNFVPLGAVHRLIAEIAGGSRQTWRLSPAWRSALARWTTLLPGDLGSSEADDYAKWLLPLDRHRLPRDLRIASKNAQSYGYIGDSAFIEHRGGRFAVGLSAVLFVDRDGVLNDARYAYAEIGRPFLRQLGTSVLAAERKTANEFR